jgi:iron complex outermembrane recepter protein
MQIFSRGVCAIPLLMALASAGAQQAGSGLSAVSEPERSADEASAGAARSDDARTIAVEPLDDASTQDSILPTPSRSRFIEEIVVTAQKREENLHDVPISVQAFSGELLDAKGIEDPRALQLVTPGLQYNIIAGYSIIFLRGVGSDAFIPSADGSVATYIDNVYYPFGHGLAAALGSVERVEILKGPQGTLFGRNSTGGAINIITKGPGPDFAASVLASRGNYSETNLRAFVNVPLTDSLAVSLSGLRYSEDSYYELVDSPNTSFPKEESRGLSAKLGWSPVDALQVEVGYGEINTLGALAQLLPTTEVKPLGAALGVQAQQGYRTSIDAPTYFDSLTKVTTADATYHAPWFDLRLIGADQAITSAGLVDFDGSNRPLVSFDAKGQFADINTLEFQVLSNDSSWGSGWLQWIAGVYHIESTAGYRPLVFNIGPNLYDYLRNPPPGGLLSALGVGSLVQAVDALALQLSDLSGLPLADLINAYANNGVQLSLVGVLDTRSTSGFFQTTVDLTDRWSLTLGGRYQTETRKLVESSTSLAPNANDDTQTVPVIRFNPQSADASNFSPKVVVDYRFADDDMLFLSYSRGYKSGTYNIIALYRPSEYIEPEEVTAYELGYKGSLFNHTLRLNAAVFENEIRNLQVQTVAVASGGVTRFENAGGGRVRGADFDLIWMPLPNQLPDLVLNAGAAYLDAIYTEYLNGSGFDESTGVYFDGTIFPSRDFSGNRIVRTPEWSGNAGLSYTFHRGSSSLELAGDIYYNSGSFFTAQNSETSEENSYHVTDARASFFHEPWGLRLTAFVNNINSARYHYMINEFDFSTAKLLAPPRTYGLRLQLDL